MHPIRQIFKTKPAPRPVIADLVYFEPTPDAPEFWTVRLYRDNFDKFSKEDQLVIFNWVSDMLSDMRKIDEKCYVEVYERVPQ